MKVIAFCISLPEPLQYKNSEVNKLLGVHETLLTKAALVSELC